MSEIDLCISIPEELQKYQKHSATNCLQPTDSIGITDFGVKLIKNEQGEIECAAYYSDSGELLKKIYYKCSAVSSIVHYRNGIPYSEELYNEGYIRKKSIYDSSGKVISCTNYEYNRQREIICIKKYINNNSYIVQYGYDELDRVNSRKILLNSAVINNQQYCYDILDRIVEYKDFSQQINVHKINQRNELISYTIVDKLDNEIKVLNKFLGSEYIGTELLLNGHKTNIKDKNYTDNILLKKPYTSEDDLDFAISSMSAVNRQQITTNRNNFDNLSNKCIDNIIQNKKPLPISIRKKLLIMTS